MSVSTPNIPTLIRTELLSGASVGTTVFAESLYPTTIDYDPEDNLAACFRIQSTRLLNETTFVYDTTIELRVYGTTEALIQLEIIALRDYVENHSQRIRFAQPLAGPTTLEDPRTEWLYARVNYRLHIVGG